MNPKKLKYVARLARNSTTEGERQAALYILETNGVKLDDIEEDEEIEVEFTFKTSLEKQLIAQVYCRIMNSNVMNSYRLNGRKCSVYLPKDKVNTFKDDVSTILSLWRRELQIFLSAFIQKNQLFSDLPPDDDSEISWDEIEQIMMMAKSIKQATLGRLLQDKNLPPEEDSRG